MEDIIIITDDEAASDDEVQLSDYGGVDDDTIEIISDDEPDGPSDIQVVRDDDQDFEVTIEECEDHDECHKGSVDDRLSRLEWQCEMAWRRQYIIDLRLTLARRKIAYLTMCEMEEFDVLPDELKIAIAKLC
jgi:hypothetical protein